MPLVDSEGALPLSLTPFLPPSLVLAHSDDRCSRGSPWGRSDAAVLQQEAENALQATDCNARGQRAAPLAAHSGSGL